MKLWARYTFALIVGFPLLLLLVFKRPLSLSNTSHSKEELEGNAEGNGGPYLNTTAIQFLDDRLVREFEAERNSFQSKNRPSACSMSTCFNYTKCLWKPFKVFVYPTATDLPMSPVYEKILRAIRDSVYYTEWPEEACLFVLSLDTIDRDWRSDNYIRELGARIAALPPHLWNEGRNHLIFNLYYGTYPEYSPADVGFDPQMAMMAWASAGASTFRDGFDISFPLFHAEHPLRRAPAKPTVKNPWNDRHLVSFKGKRYVYGIGSRTRDSLYHLHNNHSTIIATTCRHNTDWKKFEDARCERDNLEYDHYDYIDLLEDSSFCLTPRGRRLGSFRFLEALKAGCIPVILSDGWELPFSEIVDWTKAAILGHERAVFFTTDWLTNIPTAPILRMKRAAKLIYHRYFSSVEKIVLSTIEIIAKRIQIGRPAENPFDFCPSSPLEHPGGSPHFTVVIQASKRFSSRLNKMIIGVAEQPEVEKIVVLWPKARGQPPESSAFSIRQPLEYVEVSEMDQRNLLELEESAFSSTAAHVLCLDERLKFNSTEMQALLRKTNEEPNRLITFHALQHFLAPIPSNGTTDGEEANSRSKQLVYHVLPPLNSNYSIKNGRKFAFSIGLLHLAAFPRRLLHEFARSSSVAVALKSAAASIPQCNAVMFNSFLADRLLQPPILIGDGGLPPFALQSRAYYLCLNKIIRAGFENNEAPLLTSHIRHPLD